MTGIPHLVGLALAAFLAVSTPATAQDYPARHITLMVPFAAGGPTGIVARTLGVSMGKALVKPYGVTSAARLDTLKELPTLAEVGMPGVQVTAWHGVHSE